MRIKGQVERLEKRLPTPKTAEEREAAKEQRKLDAMSDEEFCDHIWQKLGLDPSKRARTIEERTARGFVCAVDELADALGVTVEELERQLEERVNGLAGGWK